MRLKAKDNIIKLLKLYNAGLIHVDDINQLVDKQKVELGEHLKWTLDQFSTILELSTDIEIVEYVLKFKGEKFDIKKLSLKKYLETLKFAKDGKDISDAIAAIKQPGMSEDMRSAGFDKLNFGDMGIARTVGEFEHIGTFEAYNLPMHLIIKSLTHIAAIKTCEKRHSEIMATKSKIK